MADTVFGVLNKQIGEEINIREESMSNGSAKDYAEYRDMCGTIRGLRLASRLIEDLLRTYMEDEDA